MSVAASTLMVDHLNVPGSLTRRERQRISLRLGAGLIGLGLLGLRTLLIRLEPGQWQIGELCKGLAAAVVGIPTLISGVRGIVTGDTRRDRPAGGDRRAGRRLPGSVRHRDLHPTAARAWPPL